MVKPAHLRELIDASHEWLLVRESGRSFPFTRDEIEIGGRGRRARFGFPHDRGFQTVRLASFAQDGSEIAVDIAEFGTGDAETLRLVPRTPASTLAAEIELARLQKADEIARLITAAHPGARLERVALNTDNGRLAQIIFRLEGKTLAAIADVTETLTPEAMLAAAMTWYDELGRRRKHPVLDIWVVAEQRRSRDLQKLHALLTDRWKAIITIHLVSRKQDPPLLVELAKRQVRDLWREKPRKLVIPAEPGPSETSLQIMALSSENIDIVYSKQGETLRFNGLPFMRVRVVADRESGWYGIGRSRQPIVNGSIVEVRELISRLAAHRSSNAENTRHLLYRTAPEAWLESILRRNIRLLDANLILSPIYNQFRSSNDKIDLLALRGDGRLVIIELKTQPDREAAFQAADYWRKIELQRRRGVLAEADLFGGREIADKPALVYLVAPALSFHRDLEYFARALTSEIELWRFELHEHWRRNVKVLIRRSYCGPGETNL